MIEQTIFNTERKPARMKQDVYEHLAKTFLERKKRKKNIDKRKLWILGILFFFLFILLIYILSLLNVKKVLFGKTLIILQDKTPITLKYNFLQPGISKVKSLSFDLGSINLSIYNFIRLSIRTDRKSGIDSSVKIQFENSKLEKDAKYLTGINSFWKEFKLSLSDFKLINDWTMMKSLIFTVEDWNIDNKNDTIFIDEIKFIE